MGNSPPLFRRSWVSFLRQNGWRSIGYILVSALIRNSLNVKAIYCNLGHRPYCELSLVWSVHATRVDHVPVAVPFFHSFPFPWRRNRRRAWLFWCFLNIPLLVKLQVWSGSREIRKCDLFAAAPRLREIVFTDEEHELKSIDISAPWTQIQLFKANITTLSLHALTPAFHFDDRQINHWIRFCHAAGN